MSSRNKILDKIRKLETQKGDFLPEEPSWEGDALLPPEGKLTDAFVFELKKVGALGFVCDTEEACMDAVKDFVAKNKVQKLASTVDSFSKAFASLHVRQQEFESVDAIITGCKYLIAQTGTVVATSEMLHARRSIIYGPIHIVIAYEEHMLATIQDATQCLTKEYRSNWPSQISFITGSSRTADIEKTLVMGAHGPITLAIFIIKKPGN